MATIKSFEELEIWKLARELANEVYELFTSPPLCNDYKLKDQMNGSSGSVMDNIAEGFERSSKNEFVNFLSFSKGSLGELKSQLIRAYDRKHISEKKLDDLKSRIDSLGKRIGSFMNYLNKCIYKGLKYKDRAVGRDNSK